jgi:hypothetical protein
VRCSQAALSLDEKSAPISLKLELGFDGSICFARGYAEFLVLAVFSKFRVVGISQG